MPWDPSKPGDFSDLKSAIEASWFDLRSARDHNMNYARQIAGTEYSHRAARKIVPVNLLELASTTYLSKLMGNKPRVNVTTFNGSLRPAGNVLETVVNNALKSDQQIFKALQNAIEASMSALSVIKVSNTQGASFPGDNPGETIYRGQPWVRHVLIDDWVHDMAARAPGEWQFCGHRYEMELEKAKAREDWNPDARKALQAYDNKTRTPEGEEKVSKLQGERQAKQPFKKTCSLWEIYVPEEQLIVTLGSTGDAKVPLGVQQWTGVPRGPYHYLGYKWILGNSLPVTPAHLWMNMHLIVNGLFRKLDRQSSRQKTNTVFQSMDEKDGIKFTKASDGEAFVVQNPQAAKVVSSGGIDQSNFGFMMQAFSLFKALAGNLDLLGGLGPGSDTATQDEMMSGNATQRITQMQQTVLRFTKDVLSDYAYYLWKDPVNVYEVEIDVKGYGPVKAKMPPEQRRYDFFEHELDIAPYSMEMKTPGQKIQEIMQLLQGFLLPIMPMLQQQGISVDFNTLLRMLAEYTETPELEDILTSQGMPLNADTAQGGPGKGGGQPGGNSRPPAPPVKTSIQKRVSSPGKSNPQNREAALVQSLMGGRQQPAEQAGAAA